MILTIAKESKLVRSCFACLLLALQPTFCKIIEIKSIEEAREYLFQVPHTFAFFDVDNTLLEPRVEGPGSTQWGYGLAKRAIAEGITPNGSGWSKFYALGWQLIAQVHHERKVEFKLVEELKTATLIHDLQRAGISAMVLTSRPKDWCDDTIHELSSVGVDFSVGPSGKIQRYFESPQESIFIGHGLVLSGGLNSKPSALNLFLGIINSPVKRVVCIDDDRKPLEDIEALLSAKSIEFIGLRYGYLDEKVRAFQLREDMIPQAFRDFIAQEKATTVG